MKVKMLVRNPDEYIRDTSRDLHRHQRNVAPELHPMTVVREYTAAVNAAKLDRVGTKFSLNFKFDLNDLSPNYNDIESYIYIYIRIYTSRMLT